jgi:hypothetical protein
MHTHHYGRRTTRAKHCTDQPFISFQMGLCGCVRGINVSAEVLACSAGNCEAVLDVMQMRWDEMIQKKA